MSRDLLLPLELTHASSWQRASGFSLGVDHMATKKPPQETSANFMF
jgi:hypothetical protein